MKQPFKDKALLQLKKANGTLQKVIKMIEEDVYCIDILQQGMAAAGLMKSANKTVMENHLNSCFQAGIESRSPKKQKEMIDEIVKVINKN